ncbi:MAG: hypothetical protein JXR95_08810 [Deltaproteobacteria bacterium]|nr:hypothetical protein [Deltaproteobacteria bacterium]
MVTLVKTREDNRNQLLFILRELNSITETIRPTSRIERWEIEAVKQGVDRLFLDLIHNNWISKIERMRSLNLALRAIIYDLLDENHSQANIFDSMVELSLNFEDILINLD